MLDSASLMHSAALGHARYVIALLIVHDRLFCMIVVVQPPRLSNYQHFLQWFVKSLLDCEVVHKCVGVALPWKIRQAVAKFRLSRQIHLLNRDIYIVPCAGYPDAFAFPFAYGHEIVPVLWDTWPRYHARIIASFRRHKIKLAFFTQRQVAEFMGAKMPDVVCKWLPEGIEASLYDKGDSLLRRPTDLLELGRIYGRFHNAIVNETCAGWRHLYRSPEEGLLFHDFISLKEGLRNCKITVSFPRCDTNPEMAGCIETLTQRYWECMLSRTVIWGRAPKELIDFIGYDPAVAIDWRNPSGQLNIMLSSVQDYQALVDKNYETAIKLADWRTRVPLLITELKKVFPKYACCR